MDSLRQFKDSIYEHYEKVVTDEFPEQLLLGVAAKLAGEFHKQYSRFKKQYPKSAKRYSTFQVKDLDHPQTFESIIEFLKINAKTDYKKYAGQLLNMNESNVISFEQSREDFYNMF
ncbi:MAG: hypothetical protein RIG77_07495 [Cyclobacteriaceae bacterium]